MPVKEIPRGVISFESGQSRILREALEVGTKGCFYLSTGKIVISR